MKTPPKLNSGDLIYICSPAKAIEKEYIDYATNYLKNKGFRVLVSQNATKRHNYFSGSDEIRAKDFQDGLDNIEVKALLCARGGYGCVRILNYLNWASFIKNPKWILGFSDITVLHHKIFNLGIKSIHSSMPLNFSENTHEALNTLISNISGENNFISFKNSPKNKVGEAMGTLIGGNLSIIYSMLGTPLSYQFENSILFIEDVGEQLYALDRMLYALEYAQVFEKINGLIVGGMTELKDTDISTGLVLEDIVLDRLKYRKIPVCFDAPIGHIRDNRAVQIGSEASLKINNDLSILSYL